MTLWKTLGPLCCSAVACGSFGCSANGPKSGGGPSHTTWTTSECRLSGSVRYASSGKVFGSCKASPPRPAGFASTSPDDRACGVALFKDKPGTQSLLSCPIDAPFHCAMPAPNAIDQGLYVAAAGYCQTGPDAAALSDCPGGCVVCGASDPLPDGATNGTLVLVDCEADLAIDGAGKAESASIRAHLSPPSGLANSEWDRSPPDVSIELVGDGSGKLTPRDLTTPGIGWDGAVLSKSTLTMTVKLDGFAVLPVYPIWRSTQLTGELTINATHSDPADPPSSNPTDPSRPDHGKEGEGGGGSGGWFGGGWKYR